MINNSLWLWGRGGNTLRLFHTQTSGLSPQLAPPAGCVTQRHWPKESRCPSPTAASFSSSSFSSAMQTLSAAGHRRCAAGGHGSSSLTIGNGALSLDGGGDKMFLTSHHQREKYKNKEPLWTAKNQNKEKQTSFLLVRKPVNRDCTSAVEILKWSVSFFCFCVATDKNEGQVETLVGEYREGGRCWLRRSGCKRERLLAFLWIEWLKKKIQHLWTNERNYFL